MTQLKAIIFDVDGTLANTEEAHRQAFNKSSFMTGSTMTVDGGLLSKGAFA